jgi:hypothetical protein
LLKPLDGQFEQGANAHTLRVMGMAHIMNYLNPQALDDWNSAAQNKIINYPSDPTPLIGWLLKKQWSDTQSLHHDLWENVNLEL